MQSPIDAIAKATIDRIYTTLSSSSPHSIHTQKKEEERKKKAVLPSFVKGKVLVAVLYRQYSVREGNDPIWKRWPSVTLGPQWAFDCSIISKHPSYPPEFGSLPCWTLWLYSTLKALSISVLYIVKFSFILLLFYSESINGSFSVYCSKVAGLIESFQVSNKMLITWPIPFLMIISRSGFKIGGPNGGDKRKWKRRNSCASFNKNFRPWSRRLRRPLPQLILDTTTTTITTVDRLLLPPPLQPLPDCRLIWTIGYRWHPARPWPTIKRRRLLLLPPPHPPAIHRRRLISWRQWWARRLWWVKFNSITSIDRRHLHRRRADRSPSIPGIHRTTLPLQLHDSVEEIPNRYSSSSILWWRRIFNLCSKYN